MKGYMRFLTSVFEDNPEFSPYYSAVCASFS